MKKDLIWFGPTYSYSGYAMHNRSMIFELHKLGWNIKLLPTEKHIPDGLIGKDLLLKLTQNYIQDMENCICINLIPPPAIGYFSKYTILFSTLESKTVHRGYLNRCTQFDELWFPCKDNVRSILDTGCPKQKLFLCPEGVHTGFYNPNVTPTEKYKSDKFTFFYCGDWSYRKGVDLLIRAFAHAFKPSDNVRLLLLSHYQGNGKQTSEERISAELMDLCQKHNLHSLPQIDFIFEHIEDEEMPNIFKCADVGVFPTRGEAWLLPAIQLMATGVPVITTSWGGQTDYINNDNGYLIPVEKFDIMDDKVNLVVEFYMEQLFAEPSIKHFIKLLQYTYTHQEEVKLKGRVARIHCEKYWTWKHAGKIADRRLTKIGERKEVRNNEYFKRKIKTRIT